MLKLRSLLVLAVAASLLPASAFAGDPTVPMGGPETLLVSQVLLAGSAIWAIVRNRRR